MDGEAGPGFGIYVHWPFCESKCPYCDFNSHAAEQVDQRRWLDALRREVRTAAEALEASGEAPDTVTSIFFGGGTPSLMDPETVSGILEAIATRFPVSTEAEVTLEANPSSAEVGRFRGYATAGVNRVSIGVQSLHDDQLVALGRLHGREAAIATIKAAREIFPRYSFDLIYARPEQTNEQWEAELTEAIDLAGDHLSVYQLTIEPGTTFARDGVPAAEEGLAETMYHSTQRILSETGLPAYEVSNHAAPGGESRHNMTYWRGGGYLGIGPGAHGRLRGEGGWRATYCIHDPCRWIEAVESKGNGTAKSLPLSAEDRRDEVIMTGLRLTAGIRESDFEESTGLSFDDALETENVRRLVEGGFLEKGAGILKATPEGMLRLNAVIATLLAD